MKREVGREMDKEREVGREMEREREKGRESDRGGVGRRMTIQQEKEREKIYIQTHSVLHPFPRSDWRGQRGRTPVPAHCQPARTVSDPDP